MSASDAKAHEEQGRGGRAGCGQPPCPVCGGPLIPLRGQYRCSRCLFSLCVGCEPEEVPASAETGD
jgi:hypothetical protein